MKKQFFAIASIAIVAGVVSFASCKKEDTSAPVITITGGNSMSQSLPASSGAGTFTAPSATATDDEDGDLSTSITVDASAVDPNTKGSYTVTYTVSDAAGNSASETLTVDIVNDAENLVGGYTCVDSVYNVTPSASGLPWVTPYTDAITTDNSVNNKIWVAKFGAYTGGTVYMTVTGSGTGAGINIPIQTVTCGTPSAARTFSNDTQTPAATVAMFGSRPYWNQLYYKEVVTASSSTANSSGRYLHN